MYRYNRKKRELAKRYTREKLGIGVFNGIFVPIIFLFILISSDLNSNIVNIASGFGILSAPVYAFVFMTLLHILRFPVHFYSSYIYEHNYKLSNYTIARWFKDYFKRLFLGYVFFIPVVTGFFLIAGMHSWWIYATIAYFLLTLAVSYIFPIIIMPFMYKIEPYKDTQHKNRLLSMTRKFGLTEIKNVVVVKESEKSKKPNAVFMGIGKTKTIGLFDTLIHSFPRAEVESVIWHELGHYVGKDNIRHVIIETFKMAFMLLVIDYLFAKYSIPFSIMSFPVIMLSFMLLELLTMPITNTYSRHLEKKADLFSLDIAKKLDAHVSAEMRLADMHLSELRVHPLIEFFFYTHPMTAKRIQYAKEWWKKMGK